MWGRYHAETIIMVLTEHLLWASQAFHSIWFNALSNPKRWVFIPVLQRKKLRFRKLQRKFRVAELVFPLKHSAQECTVFYSKLDLTSKTRFSLFSNTYLHRLFDGKFHCIKKPKNQKQKHEEANQVEMEWDQRTFQTGDDKWKGLKLETVLESTKNGEVATAREKARRSKVWATVRSLVFAPSERGRSGTSWAK